MTSMNVAVAMAAASINQMQKKSRCKRRDFYLE